MESTGCQVLRVTRRDSPYRRPVTSVGQVHEVVGGIYRVQLDNGGSVDSTLRGRLKARPWKGGRVVIGDRVRVALDGGDATVEEVLPRRTTFLRRGAHGRTAKVMAANLDRVVVVMSARDPALSLGYLDRILAVCEASALPSTLVINKQDLPGARASSDPVRDLYRGIGYEVVLTSAESGLGLEQLRSVAVRGICALVGPSGAGKSSLLNRLDPSLGLRIGDLSRKTATGRHTTVTSRLVRLSDGTLVADTPGFGDVGLWGVPAKRLDRCFPEIEGLADGCRFRGCSHVHEPDCAVRESLRSGRIAQSRYAHYQALLEEID